MKAPKATQQQQASMQLPPPEYLALAAAHMQKLGKLPGGTDQQKAPTSGLQTNAN